ncbi:MAG: ATP-binding cassette domain-containing protein [Bacteroidales bacterium]|jgi:ABC-type multidrug transport system ATPase subunit|nr:ATP-binding cassette domain-containing protein [Bacteroidales bacterium]
MRESVLHALIHIFAIISTVNPAGVTTRGKKILRAYLRRYLNQELEEEYFKLYENNLQFYERELKAVEEGELSDENSLITFQITNICRQIKKGLFIEERMIVFLQLLEFVFEDGTISEQESSIVDIVARTFNISRKEKTNASAFMLGMKLDLISHDSILAIEGEGNIGDASSMYDNYHEWHHMLSRGMKGTIYVLYIESTGHLLFMYEGRASLHFKGRIVVPKRPFLLEPGVNIRGQGMAPLYYTSIFRKFIRPNFTEYITFEGHDIEYHFKGSDNGIQPMSFAVKSGNLVGIMGGSGVGKSTLLNILNGKLTPESGSVYINGYDLHNEPDELNGLIGYVPQDDLLIEELTVYQNLYFNARLTFGDYDEEKLDAVVVSMLKQLDLYEYRDLMVGDPLNKKISGGQRKRLNIGLELMREPAVLFADEPISGLSSHDSENVMELLKDQAINGKLVFVIIHQPSSDILKMFDKLWVLDRGGYMIYDGDPVDAIVYFKTETSQANAAESECPNCGNVETDEILQIVEAKVVDPDGRKGQDRQVSPVEWYHRYKQKMEPALSGRPEMKPLPASNFKLPERKKQVRIFIRRNLLRKYADKQYMVINLLEPPLLAFILGFVSKYMSDGAYLFSDNKSYPVFLFMSVVVALFLGLTVSAEEIFRDRKIIEREKYLNVSRSSYLFSKINFLFGLSALQTFMYVFIAQYILEVEGMMWRHWLILFTTSCFGNMVGLNISAGMKSVISIYILIPLVLVPQLLLGGAMIRFDDLHPSLTKKVYVPVLGDIMTTRWAYEAMAVEQFRSNRYMKPYFNTEMMISRYDWQSSFLIPELKRKSNECAYASGKPEYSEVYENNLRKLTYHINYLSREAATDPWPAIRVIEREPFTSDASYIVNDYLDSLQKIIRSKYLDYTAVKDNITDSLVSKMGQEKLVQLRTANHNSDLADMVLNRTVQQKFYDTEDQVIQKSDPVLMQPGSRIGRAHFYAPFKMIGNLKINTLWFNMMVVWIMNIFLFMTLYYNLLKRLLNLMERIRIPGFGSERLVPPWELIK